jgi:hypothetical protein
LAQKQIVGAAATNNGVALAPFATSTSPLVYAVAFATCMAWILFLTSLMSRSQRPWLQRGAALSAAIALTIASDFMFGELERQYMTGRLFNPTSLRDIRARTSSKIIRLISNTLLWLAQIQLVLRLFPRHRDKVIAKYGGIVLIVLETVFSVLNDFYHPSPLNPDSHMMLVPAIPVIAYFFHIAISVIFSGSVLIYALSPSRFRHAFTPAHLLHALLSIVSIASPTVFFCLDIWKPEVEGWGDYIRWVGSVACSVIVWAWVDLIESKVVKDSREGVLGREVYEEEMYQQKKKQKRFGKRASMLPEGTVFEDSGPSMTKPAKPAKRSLRSWIEKMGGSRTEGVIPLTDLPTIRHPLASNHSAVLSSTLHDGSTQDEPDSEPYGVDVRRDSSMDEVRHVHPGYSPDDYWPDEKDGFASRR